MKLFKDRNQAAEKLADALKTYQGKRPLVLGVPRGSVPMASLIAARLRGDLDIVLVHKVGAIDNPEYAIGSVNEYGETFPSREALQDSLSKERFEKTARMEVENLKRRRSFYSPFHTPLPVRNRIIILVDDGIATGSTLLAAIRTLRSHGANQIVVAAPVASLQAAELLKKEADHLVILQTPSSFFAISEFYEDFPQVTDEEVLNCLKKVAA